MSSVVMETPSGIVAEMKTDGIKYRHYNITKHAIERYMQRVHYDLDNFFVSLDRAVIADAQRASDHRIQRQIRKTEQNGGYCLFDPEAKVFFFMAIGKHLHTICTVMTSDLIPAMGAIYA
ncbi:hypothetical protein PN823_004481 [Enterobacter hormaechei]|nr:hypothetical protein [Enterobacter hormaechei]